MSDQTYLGSAIVSLKRKSCGDLADLTNEELFDFLQLVKKLENALKKSFNVTMFNWSCLMNSSYQRTPPNPHVHWQFIPRYDKTVVFAGLEFVDANFGWHYKQSTSREVGNEVRDQIIAEIVRFL